MDLSPFKICYELSLNPTKSNLEKFHSLVGNYPIDHFKKNYPIFFNCILSEIRKLNSISEDCVAELLALLNLLPDLGNSTILLVVFEEISNFLQSFIQKKSKNVCDNFEYINVHLATNIIKIFNIILNKSRSNGNESAIYSASGLLILGYVVSFILHFIQCYKERDVQNEALLALLIITDCQSPCLVEKANVVVNFAPGVFKTLVQVIQSDRKVGSVVKSRAMTCFGNLIVLMYGENSYSGEGQEKLYVGKRGDQCDLEDIIVERNECWKSETWKKVDSMIKLVKRSIIDQNDEEHWKVRLELVRVALRILEHCHCVGSAAVDLIDILIIYNVDQDKTVRDTSTEALRKVAEMTFNIPVQLDGQKAATCTEIPHTGLLLLSSVIRNNLDHVINKLGCLRSTLSDEGKCTSLQMLNGYLKIYDSHKLGGFSCLQLQSILSNLVSFCAMDPHDIDLFEDERPLPSDGFHQKIVHCDFINKQFMHFNSDRVYGLIKSIMTNIVRIVQPTLVISILSSLSIDNVDSQVPKLLLSKLVVSSLCDMDSILYAEKWSVCQTLLTTFLDPDILNLPTTIETFTEKSTSFWNTPVATIESASQRSDVIVICTERSTPLSLKLNTLMLSLVMELCASCSLCLSWVGQCLPDESESWLMQTCLCAVMTKAQQKPRVLSYSAGEALRTLSLVHVKYERSVASLIRLNGDYVTEYVARRLRSVAISLKTSNEGSCLWRLESTCRCMVTLCTYADVTLLPYLSVILDQFLFCLDVTHGSAVQQQMTLMDVMKGVVAAVARWTNSSSIQPQDKVLLSISDNLKRTLVSIEETDQSTSRVRTFLLDRHHILVSSGLRKESHLSKDDTEPEDEEDNQEGVELPSNPIPSKEAPLYKILERCIHMCSSSTSSYLRLACINIIRDIVIVINSQGKEDKLAQIVHQLWTPLEHRLCDKQFPVIIAAFDLLNTLSQLCGGFLLIKIRTSLISRLCSVLEHCAKISIIPCSSIRYTGMYKLQRSLLHFLVMLSIRTGLDGQLLEEVVDAFLLYLDDRHPDELIQACQESLRQLLRYDPGLVWFKVAQIIPNDGTSAIYGHIARRYDHHFTVQSQNMLLEFSK